MSQNENAMAGAARKVKSVKTQVIVWVVALVLGALLGLIQSEGLQNLINFIASVYTRLFQFVAVPTIALALMTTLSALGVQKNTGRIFGRTIIYTLLTTFAAAFVGLLLYKIIGPGNLPMDLVSGGAAEVPQNLSAMSYYDHFLSIVPNNVVQPFLSGNVLGILMVAAAVGLGLAFMPDSDNKHALVKVILGLRELLFTLIRALVWALPLGVVAFAAQLSAQVNAGVVVGSLGKYLAVVMGGNAIQFLIVLPLFLIARGLNPIHVLKKMSPAVMMAFFTKSSAATLPVTMQSAEDNLKVKPEVARFVLPICTTINMNGCAAFILVTSLFVMQNSGVELTLGTMITWVFISVLSAVGNAGVPMGCYFLTLSLMVGMNANIGVMGVILPLYAVIDMIETAENVWSDSCVCAMTNKDLSK
ncbi:MULTISPECIES: dicarboxylate/amino acid:cation symporter [unclassified Fibrobacter]|uniref:dicarboxylate/amino acid:cation symporter n=1 Tax=unclassified Fibrobacter TaxID=2634177 RepID=UPI000918A51C|nr:MULTISPECIES: dicarboxylate/amino acid:cation symporter [unclassified Fibrobacter]OWV04393.1 dicarboxylate/amino acid:cation symporter [Fibrobacter sp. UWH3]SHL73003.1 Na+/H+-dicarboxylate symporter [Fibrobacter sp. UWH6]